MNEEKFVDLFRVVEPDLQAELRKCGNGNSTERMKATSTAVARALVQVDRRYRTTVAAGDKRAADAKRQHADAVLGALARCFECLTAVSLTTSANGGERTPARDVPPEVSVRTAPLAWAGLGAVGVVVVFAAVTLSAGAAITAFGAATIGFTASLGVRWRTAKERRWSRIDPARAGSAPVSVAIDAQRISNAVADALLEADEATTQLSRMSRAGEATSDRWTEDMAMLMTMQGLLGANLQQDNVELGLRVRELQSALLRHGITAVAFDGSNGDLFDFERSYVSGVSEPTTLVPALTSGAQTLIRGRAVRPADRSRTQGLVR
ncbi:MAG: hypothetical protein ACLP0J_10740 [Solirubrobacteraceae bacterium]